jgi:hypothetical protein
VIPESLLIMESRKHLQQLSPRTTQHENQRGGRGIGYRIQMLSKLAIAELVETQFYVTLDAGNAVPHVCPFQVKPEALAREPAP